MIANPISIIIPVKNEEKTIEELLLAIQGQSRVPNEIVITDGGSVDQTIDIIKSFTKALPIKLIAVSHAFPGKGRNIAISQSKGEVLVSTDAGCVFQNSLVYELTEPFNANNDIEVVYGVVLPDAKSLFEKCVATATFPVGFMPSVACMAFKKYVWEQVGGYPETLRTAEDFVFLNKIKKAGFKTYINTKAVVFWRPRSTMSSFFKQYYQYAKGKGQVRVDIAFHLKKIVFYLTLCAFLSLSIASKHLSFLIFFVSLFSLWNLLTIKRHYRWFSEIKFIPKTYVVLPVVVLLRDLSALTGFVVGLFKGISEHA